MGFVSNTRQFVVANSLPMVRYEMLEGRQHMVVPMVMITEGVHAGSNGPLYYPKDELQKGAAVLNWNHKPVVVYHPTKNGESISACESTVLTKRKVGVILNTTYESGKGREPGRLKAEAWLETNKLKQVDERVLKAVMNKEMMEVSTGVFTDNEQTPGQWRGEDYHSIARNYRADHLAILPDQKGSCSIADGAGLLRNSDGGEQSSVVDSAIAFIQKRPHAPKTADQMHQVAQDHWFNSSEAQKAFPKQGQVRGSKLFGDAVRARFEGMTRNDMSEGDGEEGETDPTKKKPEDGGESPEMTGNELTNNGNDQGNPPQVIQGMPTAVNLQKKIDQAVRQSPTLPSKLPNDGTALWIASVYPTFAIFHWKGQQYSQPYDVCEDDGHVTLKGNPEMVAPTFKTVTGKILNTEAPMTKAQIVNSLIANKATRWVESDRPFLNEQHPNVLTKMLPPPTRNGSATPFPMTGPSGMTHSPDSFGTDGHDDDNGGTVEGQADAVKPGGARPRKPPFNTDDPSTGHDYDTDNPGDQEERMKNNSATVEEYIQNAPAGMREVLQSSYQTHNQQKTKIIRSLTANKNCKFRPQFLANKSLEELQLMLDLAGGNKRAETISMNYSGMGDGGGMAEELQTNSTEEALVPPVLNFAKRES